jgi:serine phosphatase RsbU (regulator of sigma subunit)
MTAKMETLGNIQATLGNKQATEEIRVTGRIDALEKNQTTITRILGYLLDRINEFKYDVKKETCSLAERINKVKYDLKKDKAELKEEFRLGSEAKIEARKESADLKEMIRQMLTNNSNNNTSQTAVSSAERGNMMKKLHQQIQKIKT